MMRGIYEYLEEPYFKHDFKNVEQAKKRVHEKKHTWYGKIQWRTTECTIGFLVSRGAQAKNAVQLYSQALSST